MDPWRSVLDHLTLLRDTWPGSPWSWDARYAMISATFPSELERAVRASAVHAFPRGWTVSSLGTAPPELQALADRTGGLRAVQRLLAGDAASTSGLFGLWWPWDGGHKTTLRIGFAAQGAPADAMAHPMPQVRELFGVTI